MRVPLGRVTPRPLKSLPRQTKWDTLNMDFKEASDEQGDRGGKTGQVVKGGGG